MSFLEFQKKSLLSPQWGLPMREASKPLTVKKCHSAIFVQCSQLAWGALGPGLSAMTSIQFRDSSSKCLLHEYKNWIIFTAADVPCLLCQWNHYGDFFPLLLHSDKCQHNQNLEFFHVKSRSRAVLASSAVLCFQLWLWGKNWLGRPPCLWKNSTRCIMAT